MLKLKRVDIHGFKSFYDRTEMKFHGSGVTAIVGPNGCGKSNISDAISWVLGEQSAKSLRGTRMEDVIFAGTRERKPLGMAQVTLSMVDPLGHHQDHVHGNGNGAGHAQQASPEDITITRRLYRSGESEYLINGKTARLRDIQDLFSGTGLGPESYAIIEQGRIGQILSNKPADRRAIIEEAAGVGKYKTRKRLAEAKLESAKQNLSRVFDILEEVGRQVNSLKRQASKARRYEELRTEMVTFLRQAVAGRFRMLEGEAARMALDLSQAQGLFNEISVQLQEKEGEHTRLQESCYRTEAELTASRARVAELNLESERTRGRLELQAKQIGAIGERLAANETETQDLETRRQQGQAELDVHTQSIARLEADSTSLRDRLQEKTAERDALQNDLRERERGLETARTRVLQLLGEVSTLRNQVVQIDEYLAAIERDSTRARKEEESASGDLSRLDQVKAELSKKLSEQQLELESLADRRHRVEEDLKARQAAVSAARQSLDEIRAALSRQKARRESLDEILSHRAYTTESVKRLFTAIEHGQVSGFKPAGVLADFVEVTDPAWEKACETFLHEELEYVVVSDWTEAERGVELMRAESDGRVTFLVNKGEATPATDGLSDPYIAGRLGDALRLSQPFSLPRLGKCFLVTDHAAAQRLASTHPDSYFLLPDGVSYHGHAVSGGRKTGGGPLALKRELRELASQVEAREREADTLTGTLEELERSSAQLAEDLEYIRAQQQNQEKGALALDHEQRQLAEEYARSGSRLSVARLELERLSREDERSRRQREQSQAAVAQREQERFDQEKALELARGEYEGLQTHAHSIGEEHARVRAELAGLDERLRGEKSAAARIEAHIQQMVARREELERELERMGVERARLLADNIELDQRAGQLSNETASAVAWVENLAAAETAGRASLAALDESLKALRSDAQSAQERRAAIEVELVRKQGDLRYLDETSRRDLNTSAAEIATSEETMLDEAGVAEVEQRSQEIRTRIEALGPVNPQALEEFQEAQQRYDFLNTQRQDLLDSIRDTEKAVQELDIESRRRFKEAFDAINENFREMFRTLFGGGQGEMRLTDETNLADSGIDIMASPPGKKLQNIALLSGGEKSLTAMALLMAIFRYTPSPFCILDEVDAPLDEPNIQRLTRLLKEMSAETQFIVITHAKRTMEAAQALYGVTMQEPGLSSLVSVRFDPATQGAAPSPTAALATV
ncbi:MAG: chromosome segregation protein [Bryobacterales bacterium]|nr:chromosome segregation protein [Bryobacterales bacterium]